MNKLTNEFNAFKEKQEALNENLKNHCHSIEASIQSLKKETKVFNQNISTENQIQSIRNELVKFERRIKGLEALNHVTYTQVILKQRIFFKLTKNSILFNIGRKCE